MGHIYREFEPIPYLDNDTFYADKASKRVYILGKKDPNKKNATRITIGQITPNNNGLMYVNENFKKLFPELWEKHYGEAEKIQYVIYIGFYLTILAIAYKIGLYNQIAKVFGVNFANVILDISSYSMIYRDNVTNLLPDRLINNMLFAHQAYSSGWFSNFFKEITEDKIEQFKALWMASKLSGEKVKVVLGVDGSNTDYNASCDLAEKGKAKSKNNSPIIAYMYVTNVSTGDPITYFVTHGSETDATLFLKVIEYLKDYNVNIECVTLDRIFCNSTILGALSKHSIPYSVMLPSNNFSHMNMMKKYRESINRDPNNLIDAGNSIYGVTEKNQIFKTDEFLEAFISFYYNDVNGAERRETLNKKIKGEVQRLEKLIAEGKEANVKTEFEEYLSIEEVNGHKRVQYNIDNYNASMMEKGCFSIASSLDRGANETYKTHQLRNGCEEGFRTIKSQLGNDALRGHSKEVLLAKFFICFISTILRNELLKIGAHLGCDVNTIIHKIDRIQMININGSFKIIRDLSQFQKAILKEIGLNDQSLDHMERVINDWDGGRAPKGYQHPDPRVANSSKTRRGRSKNKVTDSVANEKNDSQEEDLTTLVETSTSENNVSHEELLTTLVETSTSENNVS